MKSKKVTELMDWLESSVRIMDQPRMFSRKEVKAFIEIAGTEASGDTQLLEGKVTEFKSRYR